MLIIVFNLSSSAIFWRKNGECFDLSDILLCSLITLYKYIVKPFSLDCCECLLWKYIKLRAKPRHWDQRCKLSKAECKTSVSIFVRSCLSRTEKRFGVIRNRHNYLESRHTINYCLNFYYALSFQFLILYFKLFLEHHKKFSQWSFFYYFYFMNFLGSDLIYKY